MHISGSMALGTCLLLGTACCIITLHVVVLPIIYVAGLAIGLPWLNGVWIMKSFGNKSHRIFLNLGLVALWTALMMCFC